MDRLTRLSVCFPSNTKYVLEASGSLVRRYIEFADGRKVELSPRKALTCNWLERKTGLAWAPVRPPTSSAATGQCMPPLRPAGQNRARPPLRKSIADWRASRTLSPQL